MKVSEITNNDVAKYLRLEYDFMSAEELADIDTLISISKNFVVGYTGLTNIELDDHEDMSIVVMILCQDMYDNRSMYVDKSNLNMVVQTILGMHSKNLL